MRVAAVTFSRCCFTFLRTAWPRARACSLVVFRLSSCSSRRCATGDEPSLERRYERSVSSFAWSPAPSASSSAASDSSSSRARSALYEPGLTRFFHTNPSADTSPSAMQRNESSRNSAYSLASIDSVHVSASSKRESRKSHRIIRSLPFASESQSSFADCSASSSEKSSSTMTLKTIVKMRMYSLRVSREQSSPSSRIDRCAVCHHGSSALSTSGWRRSSKRWRSASIWWNSLLPCIHIGISDTRFSSRTSVSTCDTSALDACATLASTRRSNSGECIECVSFTRRQPLTLTLPIPKCPPASSPVFARSCASTCFRSSSASAACFRISAIRAAPSSCSAFVVSTMASWSAAAPSTASITS
mmetsp:Transcript_68755/g.188660  ORF Transcript_68755/g.188660 Transcript_68755/m.188660 type:complete len:360 (-) Transcript_68755:110-1189(-)